MIIELTQLYCIWTEGLSWKFFLSGSLGGGLACAAGAPGGGPLLRSGYIYIIQKSRSILCIGSYTDFQYLRCRWKQYRNRLKLLKKDVYCDFSEIWGQNPVFERDYYMFLTLWTILSRFLIEFRSNFWLKTLFRTQKHTMCLHDFENISCWWCIF